MSRTIEIPARSDTRLCTQGGRGLGGHAMTAMQAITRDHFTPMPVWVALADATPQAGRFEADKASVWSWPPARPRRQARHLGHATGS